jgi:superfamily II DNA/RNA helicase
MAGEGELDLLIATDCISEGQNLQDCDWLINYDIHWNPVRIIQRFGRIDRIGSPNQRIQLVNFWPNMELEEYINLEQRVSGRMVLLDVSATGEENLIEQQSGNPMNDLEYRRKQLLKLQDTVIDMEDLSSGVAITDLTLTDFRIDLAQYLKATPASWKACRWAPTPSPPASTPTFRPASSSACGPKGPARQRPQSDYPLAPHLPGPCRRRRHRAAALHPGQAHPRPPQAPGAGARAARRQAPAPASTRPAKAKTCATRRSCSQRRWRRWSARTRSAPWPACFRPAARTP